MAVQKHDIGGYLVVIFGAVASALGWISLDRLPEALARESPLLIIAARTVLVLLPALVAYWVATRKQRDTHKRLLTEIDALKSQFLGLERLGRVEDELNTMNRLSKVARSAAKGTASSLNELLAAIELVPDHASKERLIQRYKTHNDGLVAVLATVNEELEQSGHAIATQLLADEQMHVLAREQKATTEGLELARGLAERRGLTEGLRQLSDASEQAKKLQFAMTSLGQPSAPKTITAEVVDATTK
ncbi:MAG: hypothetical protein ACRCWJ_11210 [Casimicrobium sp.]